MKQITLTEKRFFEWHEDNMAVTLRNHGGSYGGGSEVLVIYAAENPQIFTPMDVNKSAIGSEIYSTKCKKGET